MPVATPLSYAGVAKEAVRGTGVAPTQFVPVKTITPEDVVKWLQVEVLKGAMVKTYGLVQGFKNTTWEIAGPVFADMIGFPLMSILGDVTTTATRSVSDGVTTSGSPTVTSATAAFTSADVGKNIGNANIPAGAVIQTINSGTSVAMSQNATATSSAQTFVIGPPDWHVGNLLNSAASNGQPTSQTWTDYYNLGGGTPARQYAGIQWHGVTLKFTAEGLLEHTCKATGLVSSLSVAKPVQSFTAVQPTPAWTGVATIGGTVVSTVVDGELTLTRAMALPPGMTGTQQYTQVWLGALEGKIKLNFLVNDDTELNRMLNNTQPSLDLNFTQGAGATAQQLVLHATNTGYERVKLNRGKEYVVYDMEGELVGNATDVGSSGGLGICTAKLGNALAPGTYV